MSETPDGEKQSNKTDLDIEKDDIRFIFKTLHERGMLSEKEYKKAMAIISTYIICGESSF